MLPRVRDTLTPNSSTFMVVSEEDNSSTFVPMTYCKGFRPPVDHLCVFNIFFLFIVSYVP